MRLPVAAALLTLVACSRTTEGPTPTLTAVANPRQPELRPARVCNAQGGATGWRVELTGSGFAPMPQDVLTDAPRVGMPEVTLKGPTPVTLPRERVFFVSGNQLDVDVPTKDTSPAQELAPGSYAVEVKNPSGATSQLSDALLVVPPPTLTSVTAPEGFSQTAPTPVQLTGTDFRTGEAPTVVLRGTGQPEVTLTDVAVTSPTQVTANLPANTPAGTYDVVVTNPEGCAFTLPQGLVISYVSLGTLSIDPRFGWQRQNQAITLFNAPTGEQKAFSNSPPAIFITAKLKADPSKLVQLPLRRVAVVDERTVTAVVPTCSGNAALPITDEQCPEGILPGGPYALTINDASGASGMVSEANGFTVLENPAPRITSISPSAITTGGLTDPGNPLVVTGNDFGPNAKVQLLSQQAEGRIRACDLPATGTASTTELRATVPTSVSQDQCVEYTSTGTQVAATGGLSLGEGLYVVRVQNTDNPAYANYSGLIVTVPSLNPSNGPRLSSRLTGPRADFPLVQASDDLGQPFLYALGGTDGTQALASVESAPLTLFGDVGGDCTGGTCTFRVLERAQLGFVGPTGNTAQPRRGATAVVRTVAGDTSYVYVIGGLDSVGAAVNTVERAQVLRNADAPNLLPPALAAGGSLAQGTYYYRVSAIRADTDTKNPGGETLPSDEYPVTIQADGQSTAQLSWTCSPGAAKYRIYRTVEANATSGSGQLLDEVAATAACTGSPLPNEQYADAGARTPSGDRPLPSGALGRWVAQPNLSSARGNAQARIVGDDLYVVAGATSNVSGTELASVERATFTGADLGAFGVVGNLNTARRHFSLSVANATTAPASFNSTAPDNSQDVYLVVVGGDANGAIIKGNTANIVEAGLVQNAAGTVAAPVFARAPYNAASVAGHGGWSEIIANLLFVAHATGGTSLEFRSGAACPNTSGDPIKCQAPTSFSGNLNATSLSYQAPLPGDPSPGPRFLGGETLFRAYVYVAGGFPSDAGGTPLSTIERILY